MIRITRQKEGQVMQIIANIIFAQLYRAESQPLKNHFVCV